MLLCGGTVNETLHMDSIAAIGISNNNSLISSHPQKHISDHLRKLFLKINGQTKKMPPVLTIYLKCMLLKKPKTLWDTDGINVNKICKPRKGINFKKN